MQSIAKTARILGLHTYPNHTLYTVEIHFENHPDDQDLPLFITMEALLSCYDLPGRTLQDTLHKNFGGYWQWENTRHLRAHYHLTENDYQRLTALS